MTLSPNRSFKNLNDIKSTPKWYSLQCLNRMILPLCLLIFSVLIYVAISLVGFRSDSEIHLQPFVDLSSSADHFSREWLKYQARMAKTSRIGKVMSMASDVDMEDSKFIENFLPFDTTDGMNVWDLYPPQISCPDVMRIGRVGEGGKWVCGLSHLANEKHCIMYSFGISTDISFEVEVLLTTNCIIHAFDPTVGKLPFNNLNAYLNSSANEQLKSRIHFHKQAMSDISGSSDDHTFNEHLYDTMARLGHSFIDLLKVDVEGGEWSIFGELFNHHAGGNNSDIDSSARLQMLPVGELMIELHYQSMEDTNIFFRGADKHGLIPFSREINLMPCINGGRPFAVEYSFINADNFYSGGRTGGFTKPPPIQTLSWHQPVPSVIYYLTQRSRLSRMGTSLHSLYVNFIKDYPQYPVVIFHDDLRPMDQKHLQAWVPHMNLVFIEIKFSIPQNLVKSGIQIPDRTICDPAASTLGYRHMCRFHATGVHTYLAENGFGHVEYILRLDDDSLITAPVGYDWFRFMRENNKLYGYVNTVEDNKQCVFDLWESTRKFLNSTSVKRNNDSFFETWPEPSVFYDNFEISHISLWKDPMWLAFMAHIDNTGGIYTHRWGDAPLHTIGVSLVLSKSQVHTFSDIGYRHDPFVNQRANGLPMPHADPFLNMNCAYYDTWVCTDGSGHNSTHNMTLSNVTLAGSGIVKRLSFLGSDSGNSNKQLALGHHYKDSKRGEPAERGVLYTYSQSGGEEKVVASIISFYNNFANIFHYPIVVFYSEKHSFSVVKAKSMLSRDVNAVVSFVPVKLRELSLSASDPYCSVSDPEIRAATVFFRREAVRLLGAMNFEWFMRFGDDSKLHRPVSHDIFSRMKHEKKRYGYISAMQGRTSCSDSLWTLGNEMCTMFKSTASALSAEAATQIPQCGKLIKDWPRGQEIVTNFEVSHASVWESPVCNNLFEALGEEVQHVGRNQKHATSGKELSVGKHLSSSPLTNSSINWGDSAIHTMCVIASLDVSEIQILKGDVAYHVQWKAVNSDKPDERIDMAHYKNTPLTRLDAVFTPQRLGWMGGDVASSIPLPNVQDSSLQANKLVWLFGDSIVGVSNEKQRIKEHSRMIANSIGVTTLSDNIPGDSSGSSPLREINSVKYYWQERTDGPKAIFDFSSEYTCDMGVPATASFWPLLGISVVKRETDSSTTNNKIDKKNVRLVIIGMVVCIPSGMQSLDPIQGNQNALVLKEHSSVVIVVNNPYDSPDEWEYVKQTIPATKDRKAFYSWISMTAASGNRFVYDDEYVFALVSYEADKNSQSGTEKGYQSLVRMKGNSLLNFNFDQFEVLKTASSGASDKNKENNAVWTPLFTASVSGSEGKEGISYTQSLESPAVLFPNVLHEATMYFDTSRKEWLVVSLQINEGYIQLCRAKDVTGRYVCKFVAQPSEQYRSENNNELITYAGKAHPDLLRRGDNKDNALDSLVVSYVSNTLYGPQLMFEPEYRLMYAPKFMLLDESNRNSK